MKDMVEHTGKAFLGLTLNCAHCHDHKYDPISQEEYFRFRAFFEPVQVRQDRLPGEPDCGPFQKYEYTVLRKVVNLGAVRIFDESLAAETKMYRQGDERDLIAGKPPATPAAPAFLGGDKLTIESIELPPMAWYPGLKPFIQESETQAREQTLQAARTGFVQAQQAVVAALERLARIEAQRLEALATAPAGGTQPPPLDPRLADRKRDAEQLVRAAQRGVKAGQARLAAAQAQVESINARIAADKVRHQGAPGSADALARIASRCERTAAWRAADELHVSAEAALELAREMAAPAPEGMKDNPTAAIKAAEQQVAAAGQALDAARKALEGDSTTYTPISPVYPSRSTGRRRALARWIASRDNPLTARVAANHLWSHHFGRPLVDSVFDFGVNGKKPSHPELLDWLASELMAGSGDAWRMKRLHRLIVTSSAYRQRSSAPLDHPAPGLDPDNRWLWRFSPRRAEAEVIRDSILHAAGELDLSLGGAPLENDQEAASRRRSLYFSVHPEEGGHPKFLELFDAPDPCDCYRRAESMIPQQALALQNGQLALIQSRRLARKLWEATAAPDVDDATRRAAFISAAFERILSRSPTQSEMTTCIDFLQRQSELFKNVPALANAAQGAVVPATEPAVRACESLVHALFSHNDFVTIR